ncbi:MAG: nitrogenase component 1 [Euryarchaeota archaeon]|nr:nitrogenase component 1 [Euryarchaeota archaeon]
MSEMKAIGVSDFMEKGYESLQEREKEHRDAIHDMFRDRTFHGIHQNTTWQLHRYGINCKLSGSIYAVSEITGAIPLIHGPAGCAFHQRLTPRKIYAPISDMPCTNLEEKATIYGGEEELRSKIIETYHRYHPDLIAVLPACVSGLVGDDLQGIIAEIDLPCDLLHVPCEGFAHRSRQSLDFMMKEHLKAWKDPTIFPFREIRGCGHMEVMLTIVDQLMEEQDVVEHSVNIETFGGRRTFGYARQLEETKKLFASMGITVQTSLLSCTVDELKRAPAAELNIVGRGLRWAEQMEKEFGTKHLIRRRFFYSGLDGTDRFLMEMASKLGMDGAVEEVVLREKNRALEELEKYGTIFANYDFALFMQGFFFTPHSVQEYPVDYNIPLKYLCLDTRRLKEHNVSDETIEGIIKQTGELLDEWDIDVELVLNPTLGELSDVAKKVDYVLGRRNTALLYEQAGINVLDTSIGIHSSPFGFDGKVEFAMNLLREMRRDHTKRNTIVSRLNYDETYYPMLADSTSLAAREMWSGMWCMRGGGDGNDGDCGYGGSGVGRRPKQWQES